MQRQLEYIESQYIEVDEIFVNIQFKLLFYNQNNHPKLSFLSH